MSSNTVVAFIMFIFPQILKTIFGQIHVLWILKIITDLTGKSILIIMNYNPKASNITLMEVKKMKKWRVFGYSNLYRKKYLHVYAIFNIILKMRSNSYRDYRYCRHSGYISFTWHRKGQTCNYNLKLLVNLKKPFYRVRLGNT